MLLLYRNVAVCDHLVLVMDLLSTTACCFACTCHLNRSGTEETTRIQMGQSCDMLALHEVY